MRRILIPIVIEQILAVSIGMADSMMVSSAGEAAISGVSLVDTVNLLLLFLFGALSSGGSVVISQTLGKGDIPLARNAAKQLVWVVLGVSSALAAGVLIFRRPLLSLVFGKVDADVMSNALVYFMFTALSYPFLGLYNSHAAIFRAMGNSKTPLAASVVMNISNLIGNAVLIFVFHMGAAGAAISTLVSRIIGSAMMMVLARNRNNPVYIDNLFKCKFEKAVVGRICAIGIPNGIENSMFQLGKVLTISLVSTFGTAQIAANAVGNSLVAFQYSAGSAAGIAMITVVGQCVGAGEKDQAKMYAGKLLKLAYSMMITVSLFTCIFIYPLTGLYDLSPEAQSTAVKLVIAHSITASIMHPMAFCVTNSFRAASDVRYPMIMSIVSMWVFRVGFSYVFGLYLHMGVIGVWCAMFCDWIFRASLYTVRFVRGTWLTKYKPLNIDK